MTLLILCIVLAPFPYGGITPGGTLAIELWAFATLVFTFLAQPATARLSGVRVPIAALIGIAVLGGVQLLPLPAWLLSLLSPASARVYAEAGGVLRLFGRSGPSARISIAPTETIDTIVLTLAYLAIFVSAALLLRSRKKRKVFVIALLAAAAVHVVVATAWRALLQSPDDPSGGRLHGAFVNANHFSGYLEIILALAFALLWREVLHARSDRHSTESATRFESRFIRVATRVLIWGLFAAAIALTKSRAGILVAALTTCLMVALGLSHRRVRNQRWAFAVLITATLAAGLGFVALAVRQQPILRFLASDPRDPASDLRLNLWQLSLDAWGQFPLFGSGLGTFREAFRRVQPRDLNYLVEFAHSDPLQLLVTGGAIGLLLGATAFVAFGTRLLLRWRRDERREESAIVLASLGALLAICIHGLAEFNMSIPAIPATLAAVLGLAWAATYADEPAAKHIERIV